jgi:hypothetical protein
MPAETSLPSARWVGGKVLLSLSAVLVVVGGLHLICPDRSENWKSVHLAGSLNYCYSVDSSEYVRLVVMFPAGFKPYPMRVLRPLYPALGFLVYQPLRALQPFLPGKICRQAADAMAAGGGDAAWKGVAVQDMVLAWAALILVNFALYLGALLLVFLSLRRLFTPHVALLLAMLPALHRDTLSFLLVPTTEPFNLLLPAIFLYTATLLWPKQRTGAIPALLLGVGMLGKGTVYTFANWLYEHLWIRDWHKQWRSALLCGSLFVAPGLAYLALLCAAHVPRYNREVVRYRQFVWMIDYCREGRVYEIPWRWLSGLGEHVSWAMVDWAVPLVICAFLALRKDVRRFALDYDLKRHLAVYVVCSAAFWVLGSVPCHRLDVCYYPAVVVLFGALAMRKLARPSACLWLGLLAQATVVAVTNALS